MEKVIFRSSIAWLFASALVGCGGDDNANNEVSPIVADTQPPEIALRGDNPLLIAGNSEFEDPGVSVSDNIDSGLIASISGVVDTSTLGQYSLEYSATDSAGNTATVSRTVDVADLNAPVITLNGQSVVVLRMGQDFSDPGCEVEDDFDDEVSVEVVGNVDTSAPGEYQLSYQATDKAGNSTNVTRIVTVVDANAPIITLKGSAVMTLSYGQAYVEPGVEVSDDIDTDLDVSIEGEVNSQVLGEYQLKYSVRDSSGNTATASRSVTVVDDTAPTVTLRGASQMSLAFGLGFSDPGADAVDDVDNELTVSVQGQVVSTVLGQYQLVYSATDSSGNRASVSRVVDVIDVNSPVLTLLGNLSMQLPFGEAYVEPGYQVTDDVESGLVVQVQGEVNSNQLGDYQLTYRVADTSGNSATATRTVSVVDVTAPEISLLGDAQVNLPFGEAFVDPGYEVTDDVESGLVVQVLGEVNTRQLGDYSLVYSTSDSSGNTASVTRTVSVVDVTAPEISLLGGDQVNLPFGEAFVDPGYEVTDDAESGLVVQVLGEVNTRQLGDYSLVYSTSDSSGNTASVTRTVSVVDVTAPVISLNGDAYLTLAFGNSYIEPGAAAVDDVDGNVSVAITGSVDGNTAGQYVLTYRATDSAGNSRSIDRLVEVVEPRFELQAGFYDTCLYSETDDSLRCWGYNYGAHGNGLSETIGDSFGEADERLAVCKDHADQVLTFIQIAGSHSCTVGRDSWEVQWADDQGIVGSHQYCHRTSGSGEVMFLAKAEDNLGCDFGGYGYYWGQDDNSDGKLTVNEMGEALVPSILPDAKLISFDVAEDFGCGVFDDGTTRCWGDNSNGQLGRGISGDVEDVGSLGNALLPVDLGTGLVAKEVHLGNDDVACAVLTNGMIKCWGKSSADNIGVITADDIGLTPESMGDNLLPIDFGTNPDTALPYLATTMAMDEESACAILENGKVKCWGRNEDGVLGLGESSSNSNDNPFRIVGDDAGEMGDNLRFVDLGDDFFAQSITLSYGHACALSTTNQVKCWGYNRFGQLGVNDIENRAEGYDSSETKYVDESKIYEIRTLNAANEGLALCSAAPDNQGMQLVAGVDDGLPSGVAGNGILEDGEIENNTLECDTAEYTVRITKDRKIGTRTRFEVDKFGSDYSEMGASLPVVDLGTTDKVVKLTAGYYISCALFETGKVKCWGEDDTNGSDSGLDVGISESQSVANADYLDLGSNVGKVVDITSAGYQACAVFETGKVKCWGYNEYGELGLPQYADDYVGDGDPGDEMGDNLPFVEVR